MSSRCLNRTWPLKQKEKAAVKIFWAQKTLQKKSALKLSDLTQVILSLAKTFDPRAPHFFSHRLSTRKGKRLPLLTDGARLCSSSLLTPIVYSPEDGLGSSSQCIMNSNYSWNKGEHV